MEQHRRSSENQRYELVYRACTLFPILDKIVFTNEKYLQGETVSENKPIAHHFMRQGKTLELQRHFSLDIYTTESDPAPQDMGDEKVKVLATISVDLSRLPKSAFMMLIGADGQTYSAIDFHIETVYLSASTEYSFWCQGMPRTPGVPYP